MKKFKERGEGEFFMRTYPPTPRPLLPPSLPPAYKNKE